MEPTIAAKKAINDGDQDRHKQSQGSDGTNTKLPKPCLDARLECYTLERAQSELIDSVWTQPGDNDERDLEPSLTRGNTANSQ